MIKHESILHKLTSLFSQKWFDTVKALSMAEDLFVMINMHFIEKIMHLQIETLEKKWPHLEKDFDSFFQEPDNKIFHPLYLESFQEVLDSYIVGLQESSE